MNDCLTKLLTTWLTVFQDGWLLTCWLGAWFDWSPVVWSAKRLTVHSMVLVDCWTVLRILLHFIRVYFESLLHNLIWVEKWCSKMEKHLEQDWCIFPYWRQSIFFLVANVVIMRLLIHYCHIDYNAPFSLPKILPNHCLRFFLGQP